LNGIDEKSENAANELMNGELYEKLRNGDIPVLKGIDLDALELKPRE
jgi:hypothetical protein